MKPWLQDPDVTLYHGDVLATLRELPAESVDCVVTSPPYWGLRDYGTGAWEGGDAECDHAAPLGGGTKASGLKHPNNALTDETIHAKVERIAGQYRDTCGKCGARRTDQQLGLEPTPEQYVERMVEVFREVRRVLAAHGTVWLNLGDSYANDTKWGGTTGGKHVSALHNAAGGLGREKQSTGLKAKDLVGIPWRVAFALQADGWYLRSDIIWAKPNPMPESVTDRPTKAHEYVFLLSKQPRYFFDQEAVREAHKPESIAHWDRYGNKPAIAPKHVPGTPYGHQQADTQAGVGYHVNGRNIRSVWEIATQPYPEAHFATFPEELARRAIAAGCPEQVCRVCGKARERVVERRPMSEVCVLSNGEKRRGRNEQGLQSDRSGLSPSRVSGMPVGPEVQTLGFTDCGHADYRPGLVLDPFMGSGTTAFVARKLGRHSIGIDLNAEYLALAARRLQQQSLFAEVASGS